MTSIKAFLNRARRRLVRSLLFRVVFGERSGGTLLPHTRISPAALLESEDRLVMGDHVYIGPFNFLEASGGITLGEGVQITSHCAIVTHSSHRSARLMGQAYVSWPAGDGDERPGWVGGPVEIGPYSFVGPHSLIEANTKLGRGTLVCAGSFVRGEFDDFAILDGRPAQVVGDSRDADEKQLERFPELRSLYDAWAGPAT